MVSAIDPTKPVDGVPASKADLRANLSAAKAEIEALQTEAAPHLPGVSGLLTVATHGGRVCLVTGTVTVPQIDGFQTLLRNKSGFTQLVQPASGLIIHDGTQVGSILLPYLRELSVHSDGTSVWASGALL